MDFTFLANLIVYSSTKVFSPIKTVGSIFASLDIIFINIKYFIIIHYFIIIYEYKRVLPG